MWGDAIKRMTAVDDVLSEVRRAVGNWTNASAASTCVRFEARLDEWIDAASFNATGAYVRERLDAHGLILPIAVLAVAFVLLLFGRRLFRAAAALAAFGGGFVIAFWALRASDGVDCVARFGAAAVAGGVLALLALCLVRLCVFVLGAAAVAASVHYVFLAFPELHDAGDLPQLGGRSVAYWLTLCVGLVVGGVAARCYGKLLLEAFTATLGGMGLAYGVDGLARETGVRVAPSALLALGISASLAGTLLQRQMRLGRPVRPCRRTRGKSSEDARRSRGVLDVVVPRLESRAKMRRP